MMCPGTIFGIRRKIVELMVIPEPLQLLRFQDQMIAYQFIDTPYVWGWQSAEGADCSGFQIYRYRKLGIVSPNFDRAAQGLCNLFIGEGRIEEERMGALAMYGLSWQEVVHCAVSIGGGLSIDAIGTRYLDTPERAREAGALFDIMKVDRRADLLGFVDPFEHLKAKGVT